ncbi:MULTISPECIES: glycosyltransferase family 2 protein [unclassified Staphylococcus]|uniref:glycosyltransferase family 2 protein n=1 Tax=unclassified Staphylococcus TaxID=91994 RepID=UPI0021D34AC8|nr:MULTISPECIES: glycosyltransferase family 2 protein [unclassified Staphylococcus]UXR75698.1 glycosyltransferase [Staphylococcus sp. IVB6233]UXR79896.1 glycosyltransferase [Staphylococcus sp. IVB6218]
MTKKLSIIIPLFNRETVIQRLLQKIQHQTFDLNQVEVIICDGASTDHSVEVVHSFRDHIPNLIILESPSNSGGASVSRNRGLDVATGEWILFIDSDDYITEHTLSDAFTAIMTYHDDMVCLPYFRGKNSTRPISRSAFSYQQTVGHLQFENTKLHNSLNIIGKFIKRDIIESNNIRFPVGIKVREDNWFSMQVYSVVNGITILGNERNYYFTEQQDDVALTRHTKTPPRDAVKIFIAVYDFIMQHPDISHTRKITLLTIFLNRYTNMIQRGQYAPVRFFDHTKDTLKEIHVHHDVSADTVSFINRLFSGDYDQYRV